MKKRMTRLSILVAVAAIVVSATMFGSQVFSEPCEVDGPCLRDCEDQYDVCAAACPGPPFELECIRDCLDGLAACSEGCITCP
jgi:hypothetical protein